MRSWIIAGISGSGKSHVLRAVSVQLAESGCESLMITPQCYVTNMFEHLASSPGRQSEKVLKYLADTLMYVEDIEARFSASNLRFHRMNKTRQFHWVAEGFCYDALAYYPTVDKEQVSGIERRLYALGTQVCFLYVPQDAILEQCVLSTRRFRGPGWRAFLASIGDQEAQVEYFWNKQVELERVLHRSPLRCDVIDTRAREWDKYAHHILTVILKG